MDATTEQIAYPDSIKTAQCQRTVTSIYAENHEIEWAIAVTTSIRTRVGILCLLKVYQTLGRFNPTQDIPTSIVSHISRQLLVERRFVMVWTPVHP